MAEPDFKALLGFPGTFTGALLLGEPKPWVHEPSEMYQRRMIGRKFDEWMEAAHPEGDRGVVGYSRAELEAAFRAGYDTPECW
jgi:hypothetical protein